MFGVMPASHRRNLISGSSEEPSFQFMEARYATNIGADTLFDDCDFGAPHPERYAYMTVMTRGYGSHTLYFEHPDHDNVTAVRFVTQQGNDCRTSIFGAHLPEGEGWTARINMGITRTTMGVGIYRAVNFENPLTPVDINSASNTGNPNLTLNNAPDAPSFAIACAVAYRNPQPSYSWSGVDEDARPNLQDYNNCSTASRAFNTPGTKTITCSYLQNASSNASVLIA